jgi:hypothetical protein
MIQFFLYSEVCTHARLAGSESNLVDRLPEGLSLDGGKLELERTGLARTISALNNHGSIMTSIARNKGHEPQRYQLPKASRRGPR